MHQILYVVYPVTVITGIEISIDILLSSKCRTVWEVELSYANVKTYFQRKKLRTKDNYVKSRANDCIGMKS